MHIESLQLFHQIASEKSISKVAISSHISQPALSQQMKKLEESVDAKLFERFNRGVELTSAGKIMESYSIQLSQIYDNLIKDLDTLKECNSTIKISSATEFGMHGLPCTLKKIKKTLPSYTFDLSLMPSFEVEQQVIKKQADIGFIIGDLHVNNLISKPFRFDKIILVASKDLNIKDKISIDDFSGLPFLQLSNDFTTRFLLENYLTNNNIGLNSFNIKHTLNSMASIKTIILDGNGVAFLPCLAVKKELNANLFKIIEVDNFNLDYKINMIFNPYITKNTENIISNFAKYTRCLTFVA